MRVGLLATALWPHSFFAHAASTQGTTQATVVSAIHISSQTELDFGRIESIASAGTIMLSAQGQRTTTGAVALDATPYAPAFITVQGQPHTDFRVTLPEVEYFTRAEGTDPDAVTTLEVRNFSSISTNTQATNRSGRTSASGQDIVRIGGTLHVPANAAPGHYHGEVTITVAY